MSSSKSSAGLAVALSPKCLKSTTTTPMPTCSTSARFTSHHGSLHDGTKFLQDKTAVSRAKRPGASPTAGSSRSSCDQSCSRATHATNPLRLGYCKFPFQDWLKEQNYAGADMYVTWNRAGICLPREE